MKKHSTRFTLFTLLCVPFLMASATLVHGEEIESTEATSEVVATEETTESSTPLLTEKEGTSEVVAFDKIALSLKTNTYKATVDETGKIELATKQDDAFKTVKIKGEFKPFDNKSIKVEKDGTFKALKETKNEKITLEYVLSEETQKELTKLYPDEDFSKPIKTEEITLNFAKKEEPKKEKVAIPLEVVGGSLKAVEGKVEVKVTNGETVTGTFKPMEEKDNEPFSIDKDGNYKIGKKARYEKLHQKVTFNLSQESIAKLATLDAYKDKEIEPSSEVTLDKKAQKDIVLQFKNKRIDTTVGGQGRLLLEDTIDGLKLSDEEMTNIRFAPLTNNEFLSIDELGNWKALKQGSGPLIPAVNLDKTTIAKLEEKNADYDLNIIAEEINVSIKATGAGGSGSGSNNKQYAPVKDLPQTGEEKLRFAGIIGVIVIGLAVVIFFVKKNKDKEE